MVGKLARERIGEWLKPEIALQFQQVLAPGCITCTGVGMEELRADVQLPGHISEELRGWGPLPPSEAIQESEDGKAGWKSRAGYDPAGDGE